MTDDDLAAIEARAATATPGPWRSNYGELYSENAWGSTQTLQCYRKVPMPDMVAQFRNEADVAFIAHVRTDIPALVAEVRRLRAWLMVIRWGRDSETRRWIAPDSVLAEIADDVEAALAGAPAPKAKVVE